jgi:hypothetical protein
VTAYILISGAGGHLIALSRPRELAGRLEAYRRDAGL